MLLLNSTSDILRIVTGNAADIDVHASYVDNDNGTILPDREITANINTAATTTIVASPAAGVQRNVKRLNITNVHATESTMVTVQAYDGTDSVDLMGVFLMPGENMVLDAIGAWHHYDAQGGEYTYAGPAVANLGINGTLAETIPRQLCPEVNTTVAASGTLFMQAIYLKAGQLISNITMSSATTAANTPTNYAVGLYDQNRALLANSANQGTAAWPANTVKTFALTVPYRVLRSGLYYIGYYMTATAVITAKGGTAKTGAQLAGAIPVLHGTSNTGLTTTLPNPANAITVSGSNLYFAVS